MISVRALLGDATARLRSAGVGSPRVDAELLLAALLGADRGRLVIVDEVPVGLARTFEAQVTRRIGREPLQHIIGTAPFRHLEVRVGPGVFVPRPETELLVDAVLAHLQSAERPAVVDLCAGSGALALAIADEVPTAEVVAVERSLHAARWLVENVSGTRVRVVVGDIREPDLLRSLYGRADAVVCNPPYVPLPAEVEPEVLADPHEAIFAGRDGLDLMSTVVTRAALLLRPGAILALEHDDTHGTAVPALLAADGRFTAIEDRTDLAGRPRYAVAARH